MLSAAQASGRNAVEPRPRSRSQARLLFLAVLFGLALGGAFAAAWLGLERAWTGKATLAFAIVAGAGALAAAATAMLVRRLAMRSYLARFSAAALCLVIGTATLASFGLFLHAVSTTAIPTDSLAHMILFTVTLAAGAAYSFLGVGTALVLLPGLPVILVAALVIACRPR